MPNMPTPDNSSEAVLAQGAELYNQLYSYRLKLQSPNSIFDLKDKAHVVLEAVGEAARLKLDPHDSNVEFIQRYFHEYVAKIREAVNALKQCVDIANAIQSYIQNGSATSVVILDGLQTIMQARELYKFYAVNLNSFNTLANTIANDPALAAYFSENDLNFLQQATVIVEEEKLKSLPPHTWPIHAMVRSIADLTKSIYEYFNHKVQLSAKTAEGISEYLNALDTLLLMDIGLSDFDFVDRLFRDETTRSILTSNSELLKKATEINTKFAFTLSKALKNTGIDLYKKIPREELLNYSPDDAANFKNISAYNQFSDQITLLVNDSIYASAEPASAVAALERWIAVAYISFKDNDFNASSAIITALNNSSLLYDRDKEQLIPVNLFHQLSTQACAHLKELEILTRQALISRNRVNTKIGEAKKTVESGQQPKESISDKFKVIWKDKADALRPLNLDLSTLFFASKSKGAEQNLEAVPLIKETLDEIQKVQETLPDVSEEKQDFPWLSSVLTATKLKDFNRNIADQKQSYTKNEIIAKAKISSGSNVTPASINFDTIDSLLQVKQKRLAEKINNLVPPVNLDEFPKFFADIQAIIKDYNADRAFLSAYEKQANGVENNKIASVYQAYQANVKQLNQKILQIDTVKFDEDIIAITQQLEAIKPDLENALTLVSTQQRTMEQTLEVYQILIEAESLNKQVSSYKKIIGLPALEDHAEIIQDNLLTLQLSAQVLDANVEAVSRKIADISTKLHNPTLNSLLAKLQNNQKIVYKDHQLQIEEMSESKIGPKGISRETLAAFEKFVIYAEKTIKDGTPDTRFWDSLMKTQWAQNILHRDVAKDIVNVFAKGSSLENLRERVAIINAQIIDNMAQHISFNSACYLLNITTTDMVFANNSALSPNLEAMNQYANYIADIMEKDILSDKDPNAAVLKLDRWIKVVSKLHQQGDYNDSVTCLMKLASGDVSKLLESEEFKQHLSKEAQDAFFDMQPLITQDLSTLKGVRNLAVTRQGPMIPYMATFVADHKKWDEALSLYGSEDKKKFEEAKQSYLSQKEYSLQLLQKAQDSIAPLINRSVDGTATDLFFLSVEAGKVFDTKEQSRAILQAADRLVKNEHINDIAGQRNTDSIELDFIKSIINFNPSATVNPNFDRLLIGTINHLQATKFESADFSAANIRSAVENERAYIADKLSKIGLTNLSEEQLEYIRLHIIKRQVDEQLQNLSKVINKALDKFDISKVEELKGKTVDQLKEAYAKYLEKLSPGALMSAFTSPAYFESLRQAKTPQNLTGSFQKPIKEAEAALGELNLLVERLIGFSKTNDVETARDDFSLLFNNWLGQCQQIASSIYAARLKELSEQKIDGNKELSTHLQSLSTIKNSVLDTFLLNAEKNNIYLTNTAIIKQFNALAVTEITPIKEFEQVWFLLEEIGAKPTIKLVESICAENQTIREKLKSIKNQEFLTLIKQQPLLLDKLNAITPALLQQINAISLPNYTEIIELFNKIGLKDVEKIQKNKIYFTSLTHYFSEEFSKIQDEMATVTGLTVFSLQEKLISLLEQYQESHFENDFLDASEDQRSYLQYIPNIISAYQNNTQFKQRLAVAQLAKKIPYKTLEYLFKKSVLSIGSEDKISLEKMNLIVSDITSLAADTNTNNQAVTAYLHAHNIVVADNFLEKFAESAENIREKLKIGKALPALTVEAVTALSQLKVDNWEKVLDLKQIAKLGNSKKAKDRKRLKFKLKAAVEYLQPIKDLFEKLLKVQKDIATQIEGDMGADALVAKMAELLGDANLDKAAIEAILHNAKVLSLMMEHCDQVQMPEEVEEESYNLYEQLSMGAIGERGYALTTFEGLANIYNHFFLATESANAIFNEVDELKLEVSEQMFANINKLQASKASDSKQALGLIQLIKTYLADKTATKDQLLINIDTALTELNKTKQPFVDENGNWIDKKTFALYQEFQTKLMHAKGYIETAFAVMFSLTDPENDEYLAKNYPNEPANQDSLSITQEIKFERLVPKPANKDPIIIHVENDIKRDIADIIALAKGAMTGKVPFASLFEPKFKEFKQKNDHIRGEILDMLKDEALKENVPELWYSYYKNQVALRQMIIDPTLQIVFSNQLQVDLGEGDYKTLNDFSMRPDLKHFNFNKLLAQAYDGIQLNRSDFEAFKSDSQKRWLSGQKLPDATLFYNLEKAASQAITAKIARLLRSKIFGKKAIVPVVGDFIAYVDKLGNLPELKILLKTLIDLGPKYDSGLRIADLKKALQNLRGVMLEEKHAREFYAANMSLLTEKKLFSNFKEESSDIELSETTPLLKEYVHTASFENATLPLEGTLEFRTESTAPVLSQPVTDLAIGNSSRANPESYTGNLYNRILNKQYVENSAIDVSKFPDPTVVGNSTIKFDSTRNIQVKADGSIIIGKDKKGKVKENDVELAVSFIKAVEVGEDIEVIFSNEADIEKNGDKIAIIIFAIDPKAHFKYAVRNSDAEAKEYQKPDKTSGLFSKNFDKQVKLKRQELFDKGLLVNPAEAKRSLNIIEIAAKHLRT